MENKSTKEEAPYDEKAFNEWRLVDEQRAKYWSNEGQEILERRNPELLERLYKIADRIDPLIVIKKKPKAVQRAWRDTLREYAETCKACIRYMRIHLERGS